MLTFPSVEVTSKIYESPNTLVYRANRLNNKEPVILKILKENYPTPQELARYRTEYNITKSLNLTGCIKAYDLQPYQNTLVMFIEDFGGESLKNWMQQKNFTIPEFLNIAIATTQSLEQIHNSNIIHKDINPSNIVFNQETNELKIIDFGISTQLTKENPTLQNPNILEGTLAYMSPEQTGRMNRTLDYRTDFYSLGVTFYELLTGQLPFPTDDVLELVHFHLAKNPTPPSQINPEIPPILSEIVLKLMAKTAENRYQSALGIQADLAKCRQQFKTNHLITNFPLGEKDISTKFQISQKLYGRETEVATLLSAFDRVKNGCELILIGGYSGTGKTALVQELYKPITQSKGYFISGKFDQYQRNIPYSAILNAFRDLIKQLLTEPETSLQNWREKLLEALGINSSVIIKVIPELELILGKQPPVLEVGLTEAQNRFNFTFQNFIKVFTKPDKPLTLFLDDLQWADAASLKLMQVLMSASSPGLFVIGAYRDNEVSETHPLNLTVDEMVKYNCAICRLFLSPLDLSSINQLISDSLNCLPEKTHTLADLVLIKTGGNPFFINEFLKSLYREELLVFDFTPTPLYPPYQTGIQGGWQWDIGQIQARGFTENVVELMADKIQKMPEKTQEILKISACIGNQYDLKILALICEENLEETIKNLQPALAEGLTIPLVNMGDVELAIAEKSPKNRGLEYKFVHDKIQQAAYSLIAEEDRPIVHWNIGKLLLANTSSDKREEKIFDIVNQLNAGLNLIYNQAEKEELAKLNLIAGKKAKAAIASNAAQEYLNTGIRLLASDSWQYQYELTLALYQEAAEVAHLCLNFEQMETCINVVLQNAKNILDKVKVYEVKIQACMAQQNFHETVQNGLKALELLGVSFPVSPTTLYIQQRLEKIRETLKKEKIENLINLPVMTDPHAMAVMRILSKIVSSTYIVSPELWSLIVCELMKLSLKYGNTPSASLAYTSYSFLSSKVFQDFGTAYEYGVLALRLLKKFNSQELKSNILLSVGLRLIHGKSHLRESLTLLEEANLTGIKTGALSYAIAAAFHKLQHSYFCGLELTKLEHEAAIYSQTITEGSSRISLNNYLSFNRKVFLTLINIIHNTGNHSEEELTNLSAISRLDFCILFLNKLILCYLFANYTQAVENAAATEQSLHELPGLIYVPVFFFYDSLAQLAIYSSTENSKQETLLLKVNKNQENLQKWAESAPMNFKHKWYLVEAEKARVLEQFLEAMEHYDKAIFLAKENEYINEAALAYELAGKFYLSINKELTAKAYMQESRYCYQLWGARAKVKDLETRYPELLTIDKPAIKDISPTTSTTGSRSSSSLDIDTLMKASEAISGEIILDKLLSKLMIIIMENVGAQKGYLILENQHNLLIEAEGSLNNEPIKVLHSLPVQNCPEISETIINYVARTKENVVLNDATREGNFTNDPYIKKYQPKSILCAALMNQSQLAAIVYLENNLATQAFTPERLKILQLLSGQAVIALTNAKLYAKVKERENRLTQFINAMPIGVTVIDTTGQVTYANSSAYQLSGINHIPQLNVAQFAESGQVYLSGTNQLYPTNQMPILRSLAGETVKIDDLELHRPDKIVSLEVSSTPIVDETGKINYAIATFADISERKKAEQVLADYNRTLEQQVNDRTLELQREIIERKRAEDAAKEANKAKSTFLANMSHELRTPLNAILGFTQLINRSSNLTNEQQENLKIITRSGEHLLTLINQILDLSKIEAGRITLNETNFDLHRLLDDIEDMFRLKAKNKGLNLLFERTPGVSLYVQTDEIKLRQILINLLSNAIKFTSEGGVALRVKNDPSTQNLHFEIEDTGIGIAENEIHKIFEAFVQTKTGRQSQEGTGLGLAIANSFVELLGGKISVKSSIGRGTLFKFNIKISPANSDYLKNYTPTRRAISLQPNQLNYRILIADDRLDNRLLLIQLLTPFKFELSQASNGQEVIEMWEKHSPHLIFMDMRMPVMDGYEATKQIKATTKGQSTAIVAVTASTFDEEKAVILSAGCDDCITKPFRDTSIFEALEKHIGVKFIWEETKPHQNINQIETHILTKSAFSALPPELVTNLQQAITNLDLDFMQTVISQISLINQPLGNAIADCIKTFKYEEILNLTDKVTTKI
ncbi:MAG TPA: AAA family ATPase [Halomicronema sp.]